MTGVPAPAGWEAKRLLSTMPTCVADWELAAGGYLNLRIFGPTDTTGPRAEWRTGPSGFGPDLADPDALRRFGWDVLRAAQAAADVLEHGNADVEPDPQLTIHDFREEALRG